MRLGIDRLLAEDRLRAALAGRRIGLLAHPASVTSGLAHTADALVADGFRLAAAFGPQHGMRGDKQDNMIESEHAFDPRHGIPVFSLYGKTRRLSAAMLDAFDVLLIDLQDVGCRIYTFLTTTLYALEDCARAGKAVCLLDRPNPAGRPVEGLQLEPGYESFVGAGSLAMRHGLTLGEAARWHVAANGLDIELDVISMTGYDPNRAPGYGWPGEELAWVNPSPNMASLNAARCYAGTVLLEGTTLSEGRGTTRPLEVIGAPDLPVEDIISGMAKYAPRWLSGCLLRPCHFEPTFHKHAGRLCAGIQIHTDHPSYAHDDFKPFRLVTLFLKSLRQLRPDYEIWRDFPYEYVSGRLPIDTINGGPRLRQWVDDNGADCAELEADLVAEERAWLDATQAHHRY